MGNTGNIRRNSGVFQMVSENFQQVPGVRMVPGAFREFLRDLRGNQGLVVGILGSFK